MICCVRNDSVTASSDGISYASSYPITWIDCAPPSTAPRHWIVERMTLFSGCCAVSVVPELPEKNRSRPDAGWIAPNRSVATQYHSRRAARSFATSSNRSIVVAKWNDSRGANESTASPRATSASLYTTAEAIASASSWIASHPASRAWYPVIEIGLNRGNAPAAYSITSQLSRNDGAGG